MSGKVSYLRDVCQSKFDLSPSFSFPPFILLATSVSFLLLLVSV